MSLQPRLVIATFRLARFGVQQQERQRDALRHAVVVIDSLPTTSTAGDPAYGPWDDVAIPTRAGSQRLGISGR